MIDLIKAGGINDGLYSNSQRKVVRDGNGRIHVVYHNFAGYDVQNILHSYSDDEGQTWTEEAVTNDTTYNQNYASIAVDSNGYLHVVWQAKDPITKMVQIWYSKHISSWSTPITLTWDSYFQGIPAIAIDSNDHLHVVFYGGSSTSPSKNQIRYMKFDGAWTSPINISYFLESDHFNPSIAIDSGNNIHVAWQMVTPAEYAYAPTILYRKYSQLSSSWESVFIAGDLSFTRPQYGVSIAVDSTDNPHLVWYGISGVSTYITQIRYRGYNGTWGPFVEISNEADHQSSPSIAIDATDKIHLVWVSGSSTYYQLRYAKYDGTWSADVAITTGATNKIGPSALWANNYYSKNIAGYCFVYVEGTNMMFYASNDLEFGSPPSMSPSASPSLSPSASESPSESPSTSPSASLSPSASVSPSASPSLSPSASESPSGSPSMSPSSSLSPSASLSPSRSPSASPSRSPSISPSPSPSPGGELNSNLVFDIKIHGIEATGSVRGDWILHPPIKVPSPRVSGNIVTGGVLVADIDIPGIEISGAMLSGNVFTGAIAISSPKVAGTIISSGMFAGAIAISSPKVAGTIISSGMFAGAIAISSPKVTGTIISSGMFAGAIAISSPKVAGTIISSGMFAGAIAISPPEVAGTILSGNAFVGAIEIPSPDVDGRIGNPIFDVAIEIPGISAYGTLVTGGVISGDVTIPSPTISATFGHYNSLVFAIEIPGVGVGLVISGAHPTAIQGVPVRKGFVLNLSHFGVTEYNNFPFNSFCNYHMDGTYIGASEEGIFILDGDDDDGVKIDSVIQTGTEDLWDKVIKRLREVWTVKHGGPMSIQLILDEGRLEPITRDLEIAKGFIGEERAKLPRGLKNRFVSFVFRNEGGGDFDIESIRIMADQLTQKR